MMFSSSGSTGAPRVFRYSHIDRDLWAWANARALQAMDFRKGDTVFMVTGYGPHVWAWGVQYALEKMAAADDPGRRHGRQGARQHHPALQADHPAVHAVLCAASRPRHAGSRRTTRANDQRPHAVSSAASRRMSIAATRERIEELVGRAHGRILRLHRGVAACRRLFVRGVAARGTGRVSTHLMEDIQIWETGRSRRAQAGAGGQRGLTVCTSLNSESSPQLRFLVGDYTVLDTRALRLRPHPCARRRFVRRARRRSDQSARHQDVSDPDRGGGARRCREPATNSRSCCRPTTAASTS